MAARQGKGVRLRALQQVESGLRRYHHPPLLAEPLQIIQRGIHRFGVQRQRARDHL